MFDGATYEPDLDRDRLGRQLSRVLGLMGDGRWRSLADITRATGAPPASVSARLRDLRKPKFGSYQVERQRLKGGLFLYRVLPPAPPSAPRDPLQPGLW